MGNSQDESLLDPPAPFASLAGLISRRRALGTLAGGGIATGLAARMSREILAKDWSATPSAQSSGSASSGDASFNYRLGASAPHIFAGGTVRTVTGSVIRAIDQLLPRR